MACPRCGDTCRCRPELHSAQPRPKFEPDLSLGAAEAPRVSSHGVVVDPVKLDEGDHHSAATRESSPPARPRFVVDVAVGSTAREQPGSASKSPGAIEPGAIEEEADSFASLAPPGDAEAEEAAGSAQPTPAVDGVASAEENEPRNPDSWRQELSARLHRYHSRRKPRGPRYPSLRLKFDAREHAPNESSRAAESAALTAVAAAPSTMSSPAASQWTMSQILAAREEPLAAPTPPVKPMETIERPAPIPQDLVGNLIEFPRWNAGPPAPPNELAEPVMQRPRIVEAPEVTPLPPALGGILIEPVPEPEIVKQPGIDLPLQSASLERRLLAAGVDAVTIAAACVIFGYVFFQVSAPRLSLLQVAEAGAILMGVLWAAYQYLFLVHTATTLGLRFAKLELCRFDGTPAGQRIRRARVLVSLLSAASLGLGYAWYFLDEDALCWHDRITHTYLGSNAPPTERKP